MILLVAKILARLPLRGLYVLSDISYFLLYYLFRYRKKIVLENLAHAFPEKTPKERLRIAKKFYCNLTDAFFETIKVFHWNDEAIRRRCPFEAPEKVLSLYDGEKSVIFLLGHLFNWEWVGWSSSLNIPFKMLGVYYPPHHKGAEKFVIELRKKCGLVPVAIGGSALLRIPLRGHGIALLADQNPGGLAKVHWTQFLNQETAFLTGFVRLAKSKNCAVIWAQVVKYKRGYYAVRMDILTQNEQEISEEELTELYVHKLEKAIQEQPETWLWSHRRWKHQRFEN